MAGPAEQAVVVEAAFAAAVGNGDDVVGFPAGTAGAPRLAGHAIAGRRLRARPLTMRLDDVEAAQLTDSLVAFLDFAADVPRAASDLPLVHAGVAAERAARRRDDGAAPAADRLSEVVTVGDVPLVGGDGAGAAGAHAANIGGVSVGV